MTPILAVPSGPETDAALARLRDRLLAQGRRLSGVIQTRAPAPDGSKERMVVEEAAQRFTRIISQDLGAGASGCRLDPGALEQVVADVATTLPGADVLFVNRFGKQEELGRGFAPLIAEAVGQGSTVIVGVADAKRPAFEAFAGDMARWVTVHDLETNSPFPLSENIPG